MGPMRGTDSAQLGPRLNRQCFSVLGGPRFEDAFPDFLCCVFDVLHRFANARAGGFVSAFGLCDIIRTRFDELLEAFVCLHGLHSLGIGVFTGGPSAGGVSNGEKSSKGPDGLQIAFRTKNGILTPHGGLWSGGADYVA